MYIRKSISKQKGKTYTNYLLVKSVQTPKGPRQRVVCSLGNLAPAPKEGWLALAHKLEASLKGQLALGASQVLRSRKLSLTSGEQGSGLTLPIQVRSSRLTVIKLMWNWRGKPGRRTLAIKFGDN
jgi:hypothetical protein